LLESIDTEVDEDFEAIKEGAEMNMPGFTAEASVPMVRERYVVTTPSVGVTRAFRQGVVPQQLYFDAYTVCSLRCYLRCVQIYGPAYSANCWGVASTCCKYGYHCSYCGW
jgi:hypothetical protein